MSGLPDPTERFGPGSRVANYLVLEKVGQGGMSVVLAAYDQRLDRRIALKLIRRTDLAPATTDENQRLLDEARVIARLTHENVVTVYEAGTDDGQIFLAMEYADGGTLASWLQTPRPWRETVARFVQAGRGLAAAHHAGIVHGDFKPGNVLLTRAGIVRVADFGLARSWSDSHPATVPTQPLGAWLRTDRDFPAQASSLAQPSGTFPFVAPEQYHGERPTPASDQFAFCVALHLALHGELPFTGDTADEIRAAVLHGRLRPPPRNAAVPGRIQAAIARGLSVAPADRYPSMAALVAVLEDAAAPARRRGAAVLAGAGIAAAAVALTIVAVRGTRDRAVCAGGDAKFAGIWNATKKDALARAVRASGHPGAEDVQRRLSQGIDRFGAAWVRDHREACEATAVRREQSEQLLDLRMHCLDRQRSSLSALIDALSSSPTPAALNQALQNLPTPAELRPCRDAASLLAVSPPPPDPDTRAAAERTEQRLDRVEALYKTGKYTEAATEAQAVLTAARRIGHPPLIAKVLFTLGLIQIEGRSPEQADATLLESAMTAGRAHDDRRAAAALTRAAAHLAGTSGRPEAARGVAKAAEYALARLGPDVELEGDLENALGAADYADGKLEFALAHFRTAVAKRRAALGPDHLSVAGSQSNVGTVLSDLGRRREAKEELTSALRIYREALGEYHPATGDTLHNLGVVFVSEGNNEQGLAHFQATLRLYQRALGADSGPAAHERAQIATFWTDMGRYGDAERALRTALPTLEKAYGRDSRFALVARVNLANVVLEQERLQEADDLYAQLVERWKAFHPDGNLDPALGNLLIPRADIALTRGQHQLAAALAREALVIEERQNPVDSLDMRRALTFLGKALVRSGRVSEGVGHLERALRLAQQEPTESGRSTDSSKSLANSQMGLAEGLWAQGGSARRRRAIELVRAAAATRRALGPGFRKGLAEAERWLTRHGDRLGSATSSRG